VWEPLLDSNFVSERLVDVLREFDELSAFQKLMPDEFAGHVDELLGRLYRALAESEESIWQINWIPDDELGSRPVQK
jgi:hypothetical protein